MLIRKVALFAALLLIANCTQAQESEEEVANLVFVGRLVSIEQAPDPCEGSLTCISMDTLWKARYEIEKTLVGGYPQREITINIADHYGFPHSARAEHALLFVGLYSNGPWLHKYQGFPVHRLVDGGWGHCGGSFRPTGGEPNPPKPRSLAFTGELRIRDEWNGEELTSLLDRDSYSLRNGQLRCKRGLMLPELYEVVRKGALQARGVELPAWSEVKAVE
jgi:hypothetical protein